MMQSVGIEPTLLRTRALSVRLNRSAKTATVQIQQKRVSTPGFEPGSLTWQARIITKLYYDCSNV